jgi:hypothetical protein
MLTRSINVFPNTLTCYFVIVVKANGRRNPHPSPDLLAGIFDTLGYTIYIICLFDLQFPN